MPQNNLVLHKFICQEFGFNDTYSMLDELAKKPYENEGGNSNYAYMLYRSQSTVKDAIFDYDFNIVKLANQLKKEWTPFQYIALLLTERYLDLYFSDKENLCSLLNEYLPRGITEYEIDDLATLAFQSATASGKTLLLHANLLQFQHYCQGTMNNIILITQNHQMSNQHKEELEKNNIQCAIFPHQIDGITIIDVNRLGKVKGKKRVDVKEFGKNNLVMVDEGHLGASGKIWREYRKQISEDGFTFEYSATFNQIINKKDMKDIYSKCVLFDYSYGQFHADGYGKDYRISNLPDHPLDAPQNNMYLLGCLLTFYQQMVIWRDNQNEWSRFNFAKPLLVLLGKTVTGNEMPDVVLLLKFLGWAMGNESDVVKKLGAIFDSRSGLHTDGKDFFDGRFPHVKLRGAELYTNMCNVLLGGHGKLRIVHLTKSDGELQLRNGSTVFGVINIGKPDELYAKLKGNPLITLEKDMGFAKELFDDVDRDDSSVNIVLGARKFIAGWNAYRVSTMGLLHVGVNEGPEIIQMFGRGVRLKGWNNTMRRHMFSDAGRVSNEDALGELETLYIFGIRSNYMEAFKKILEKEGVVATPESYKVPVKWNLKEKKLKMLSIRNDQKFAVSEKYFDLEVPNKHILMLNKYSIVNSLNSRAISRTEFDTEKEESSNIKKYAPYFNKMQIYLNMLRHKERKGWHNMIIKPEIIDNLLNDDNWYTFYMPNVRVTDFNTILELEKIALELIKKYAEYCWEQARGNWEQKNMTVTTLDEKHPNNVKEYEVLVDTRKREQITQIQDLINLHIRHSPQLEIGRLDTNIHVFNPILYKDETSKTIIKPAALNNDEKKVVMHLQTLANSKNPVLDGIEVYLIRNKSSGGVSFFDEHKYYPDFILWLKDKNIQHVIFLDPKGLVHYNHKTKSKVELHKKIKKIEESIIEDDPNIRLHAYIISNTPLQAIGSEKQMTKDAWHQNGVYFMGDPDYMEQIVSEILS